MSDGRPAGTTGKATVREQCHLFIEADTGNSRGGRKHFPHSRTALGPLVTNNYDVARFYLVVHDGAKGLFFGIEHPGRPLMNQHFRGDSRLFDHCTVCRQVSPQHSQSPGWMIRSAKGTNNFMIMNNSSLQVICHDLSAHCQTFGIQQAGVGKQFHDCLDAASPVQILNMMRTSRGHVADMWYFFADFIKSCERQRYPGFMGDGRQME